jgi:hypothetical protein
MLTSEGFVLLNAQALAKLASLLLAGKGRDVVLATYFSNSR